MKYFNGKRLKMARLYRGLTVEELAQKINVSKQRVSQYENEEGIEGNVPFEKIILISRELRFPYEYFIQPDLIKIKAGSTYFRSLLKTNKKYRVEQEVKMEHLAIIYSILREYVKFPRLNLPELQEYESPEDAAEKLRKFWNLGNQPLSDVVRTLEKNGIIVTMFATSTNDIDAFSKFIEIDGEKIYLVALSKNKETAPRTHFDIAHELGHIILHEWSEDNENLTREEFKKKEKEANEFAAAFLMPRDTFSQEFSFCPANFEYYMELKRKWKVSIAAMLYRSCDLQIITQNQYQYIIRTMQKKGLWKNEPFDDQLQTARPSLFLDAIELLIREDIFTPKEFVQELSERGLPMNYDEIENLLGLEEGMLRPKEKNFGNIVSLQDKLINI